MQRSLNTTTETADDFFGQDELSPQPSRSCESSIVLSSSGTHRNRPRVVNPMAIEFLISGPSDPAPDPSPSSTYRQFSQKSSRTVDGATDGGSMARVALTSLAMMNPHVEHSAAFLTQINQRRPSTTPYPTENVRLMFSATDDASLPPPSAHSQMPSNSTPSISSGTSNHTGTSNIDSIGPHPVPPEKVLERKSATSAGGRAAKKEDETTDDYSQRQYLCPDCGKRFSGTGGLQRHIRIHKGIRPYKCRFEECGRTFTECGHLIRHHRSHTGERPFPCPFTDCGKAFSTSYHLLRHKRTHTGERPYACPLCPARFSQSGGLQRHRVIHNSCRNRSRDGGEYDSKPVEELREDSEDSQGDKMDEVDSFSDIDAELRYNRTTRSGRKSVAAHVMD